MEGVSFKPDARHEVGLWHAWHRSVLECLVTRKLAPWTFRSQSQHRFARSDSQYIFAGLRHSSQSFCFIAFS
ncbi:hypothetical protein SAY87_010057 [Trapa incisa]|uniref:Uncharacterized protein n=1 Tax=Trapa incisa TaxID=236973 RepID=A0AAN7GIY3_9MYRT|nr:hypothetical protein SAY87_010057 [Trapa incisa]